MAATRKKPESPSAGATKDVARPGGTKAKRTAVAAKPARRAAPKNLSAQEVAPKRRKETAEEAVIRLEAELSRERNVVSLFRDVGLAIDRWRDLHATAGDLSATALGVRPRRNGSEGRRAEGNGKAPSKVKDLDRLLVLVLSKMKAAVSADRITLYLIDAEKKYLESRIVEGLQDTTIRLKIPAGIAGRVAKSGLPERVDDAYSDPRFNRSFDKKTGYRTQSILAVPMHDHDGTILGVVQVLNKRSPDGAERRLGVPAIAFSPMDADVLMTLASQAAIVIDNADLVASLASKNAELQETSFQLLRRMRDLDLLFDLERLLGRAETVEELVLGTVRAARKVIPALVGAVAVKDRELGNALVWVVGDDSDSIKRFPIVPGQGFIGRALLTDAITILDPSQAEPPTSTDSARSRLPAADAELDALAGFVTTNAVAVPLEGEGREVLGAFALYNHPEPGGFGPEEIDLAELVAANLATALRLLLAREAREREERLTAVGRLLSGVIHDLKTPLAVISGYVDLLRTEPDQAHRTHHAELIHRQLVHLGALQKDVLEFLRGERTLFLRRVYIAPFFEEFAKSLTPYFEGAHVRFSLHLEDRGTARFDEQQISRLLQNLARNAVEATTQAPRALSAKGHPEPEFSLRVRRRVVSGGDLLEIIASDNGPGIPKEIRHRLFQSFVTSGKKDGTGLGLAIVKRIAEEHGGTVTAASTARGATFTVVLPVEGRVVEAAPSKAPARAQGGLAVRETSLSESPSANAPRADGRATRISSPPPSGSRGGL